MGHPSTSGLWASWPTSCSPGRLTSETPFNEVSPSDIFRRILKGKLPKMTGLDKDAADFISRLLQLDPSDRLGFKDVW